jgi:hypothetical protein
MKLKFKDIKPGIYPAKITDIKEEVGPYGNYLKFNFTVIEGELKDWSFYGIVKPNPFKQSKFFRWMVIIMGEDPKEELAINNSMGRRCNIYLQKKIKGQKIYYSVKDLIPDNQLILKN